MSTADATKIDVRERGAEGQTSDRRLYMQLSAFGACLDVKPLLRALESSRLEAVLYQDVNDARGVGVLAMSEDPLFFVTAWREVLNADPFAGLAQKLELTMFGRTYASGFETDLEDWLLRRPRRAALYAAWPWGIWYPLRRTGAFSRLSPQEQGTVIREHSLLGRAYGDADLAVAALDQFAQGPWGHRYPAIVASWRRAWPHVIPFFAFPPDVRKVLYTTNALESVHARLRKILKTRGHFPTDEAATKLIWLALRNITATWGKEANFWRSARNQFAIVYGDRFTAPTP